MLVWLISAGWDWARLFTTWLQDIINSVSDKMKFHWAAAAAKGRCTLLPHGRRLWVWFLTVPSCWCAAGYFSSGVNVQYLDWWPGAGFTNQDFWRGSCGGCVIATVSYTLAVTLLRGWWYIWLTFCLRNMYQTKITSLIMFFIWFPKAIFQRENLVLCSIWFQWFLSNGVPTHILN